MTSQSAIRTQGLCKSFGDVHALRALDLSVPQNSIFGFLGPNGAGKTTTMKLLLGLARPTSGSGAIFGRDIGKDSLAIRARIGYLPQHPRFIDTMTAREILHFTARFFFSGPASAIEQRVNEMLTLVDLTDRAARPVKGFSGGERQRLGLAQAQINDPELLILDEPAAALDPIGRRDVLTVMARLRERTTIFYSTHILDDVQQVSDTVAILNHGELVAQGPIERLLNGGDRTTYTVTLDGAPPDALAATHAGISALPWVTGVDVAHRNGATIWQISVTDELIARAQLLRRILADKQITVTGFTQKKYELEEIFIDLVEVA